MGKAPLSNIPNVNVNVQKNRQRHPHIEGHEANSVGEALKNALFVDFMDVEVVFCMFLNYI